MKISCLNPKYLTRDQWDRDCPSHNRKHPDGVVVVIHSSNRNNGWNSPTLGFFSADDARQFVNWHYQQLAANYAARGWNPELATPDKLGTDSAEVICLNGSGTASVNGWCICTNGASTVFEFNP